jgi:hypothetical protein
MHLALREMVHGRTRSFFPTSPAMLQGIAPSSKTECAGRRHQFVGRIIPAFRAS